jgi:AraC family transcriptional regulator
MQSLLRIERRTTLPGTVGVDALPVHRVSIHAGAAVQASCGERRFFYTRGDIDVLPAGVPDAWRQEGEGSSLVLQISPSLVQNALLVPRCGLRDAQIEHLAWALDTERREGFPGGRRYAETMGRALASRLVVHSHYTSLIVYIETHLGEDLSIGRLAAVAGIGTSQLKDLFRRSTGLGVHQYVVRRRVERARALLRDGKLPASQAALEAGFAHQSHMARWMRRIG